MAPATFSGFLQHLRKAMAAETLAAHSDREMIERFLASHDDAAFHALLRRHGPMVFRVCRRVLEHEQDVEDAFQATFLVLARQAHVIRKRASMASWLHGVAHRIALNARKANARRRKHEMQAGTCTPAAPATDDIGWKELRSIFDEELVKLPDRLGAPLVLCYLEGLTQDEAAERLGQSKGTLRRNLERGRELLGGRLTRRGITLSAALFAPFLSECAASASVPAALATSTTEAAVALAAGKAVAALATARALALAQELVPPVLSAKVQCVCLLLLATVLAGFGGAAWPKDARPVDPTPSPADRQHGAKPAAIEPPVVAKLDGPETTDRIEFLAPGIVLHAEVHSELKLTEKQSRRIRDILRDVAEKYQADHPLWRLRQVDELEWLSKLSQEKDKALRKALPEILTVTQARRLLQLERQAAGVRFFQIPENKKLLGLTDDQLAKVKAIVAAARESKMLAAEDGKLIAIDLKTLDKASVQQILKLLNEDQRKIWRNLIGEPIEVPPAIGWDLFAQPTGVRSPLTIRSRPLRQVEPDGAIHP